MKITIEGVNRTPSWEIIQTMIRETMGRSGTLLMGIRRIDGRCDYRAPGDYELTLSDGSSVSLRVTP